MTVSNDLVMADNAVMTHQKNDNTTNVLFMALIIEVGNDLTLNTGAWIHGDGRGYAPAISNAEDAYGPSGGFSANSGSSAGGGGAHGGVAGQCVRHCRSRRRRRPVPSRFS